MEHIKINAYISQISLSYVSIFLPSCVLCKYFLRGVFFWYCTSYSSLLCFTSGLKNNFRNIIGLLYALGLLLTLKNNQNTFSKLFLIFGQLGYHIKN